MQHHAHRARKRFGQNFLHDPFVIRQIVTAINMQSTDNMVEIGPGRGALTDQLMQQLDTLVTIELDRDLIPLLRDRFIKKQGKLIIHQGDALQFDYRSLANTRHKLRIVGNLPYNISTPLLFHLLDFQEVIEDMHFLLQLELVQRLAAQPGSKAYGRLSIKAQYHCQVENLFEVSPEAFKPVPKVISALVRLRPRSQPQIIAKDCQVLDELLRNVFNQRRKTLHNSLKTILSPEQIHRLDVDLSLRPEQLTVADFVQLSNQICDLGN